MPSALPSDARNKAQSMRKPERPSRRMTTLSFEQLERTRKGIFTENISASSRLPRPAYVVREADVIGANMPDTIKLSKHRSKIYVGLTETCSGHSSHRSLAATSRERTSTATSAVSKASIIDWTDAASEISAPTGLSGEFSAILPPVTTAKNSLSQPPPGLDTAEIFNFRSVVHKKRSENRSPRPPPSRGSLVPRPPHNTPFPTLSRPDEFAATFRKRVTPRKTPLENCNVVLIGGGITPLTSNTDHRTKTNLYREPSYLDNRKHRKESHNQMVASYLALPRFDLPVIDLKCVESPVSNLGDLEEKGIRLVKLRRVKKRKKKDSVLPNSDRAGDKNSHEAAIVSMELNANPSSETDIINTYRSTDSIPLPSNRPFDRKESNQPEIDLKKSSDTNLARDDPETKGQQSSITTPSTVADDKEKDEKRVEDLDVLLSNREPYSTPLLPDVDATPRAEKPPKREDDLAKESTRIHLTVEQIGNTPAPSPLTPVEQLPIEEEILMVENERAHSKRFQKRSSSLLTVPDSVICLSERRPPTYTGSDVNSPKGAVNEVDEELQKIMGDRVGGEEQKTSPVDEIESMEGRKSVTVATQTTP